MKHKKYFLLLLGIFSCCYSFAQHEIEDTVLTDFLTGLNVSDSNTAVHVTSIIIEGNERTKDYIIRRELKLKIGDTISITSLFYQINKSKELIYNTNLFSTVDINVAISSRSEISIIIKVVERWYIYPTPQFSLIDRNFNEWWNTYHGDLNRVTYGIKFSHYNVSGRADKLNINFTTGYSRNFGISYVTPYSNNKLTEGFSISSNYTQNKVITYKTSIDNQLMQYTSDEFHKNTFNFNASYRIRKGYYKRHQFTVQYNYVKVKDSIIKEGYNPHYFNSTSNSIGFPDFNYLYQYVNLDNINYPLKGKYYSFSFTKRGLGLTGGINMFAIDGAYYRFISHGKNYYSGYQVYASIKLPFEQAYINQRAIGVGDIYMRGLENYLIDGVASTLVKYTFSKKLLSFKIRVPIKNKLIPYIPFSFYAKSYADVGFAYSKKEYVTNLNNRFLYSGGMGIDLLSLYDLKFSVEYSFNQLGEKGLFLHARALF